MSKAMRASLIVVTYNQEPFIKEAISALLHQDCEPIEILISDDGSRDRTWEIVQDLVANYDGPHIVRLNQNAQNMGVNPHVNACIAMASHDIIIAASGDDISYPDRVRRVLEVFDRENALLVHSRVDLLIDDEVRADTRHDSAQLFAPRDICAEAAAQSLYIGATASWSRELFDLFGPLPDEGVFEDLILGFRAALMDRVGCVDAPLLAYRTEVGISRLPRNITGRAEWRVHRAKELARVLRTYEIREEDAVTAGLASDHQVFDILTTCQRNTRLRCDANTLGLMECFLRHPARPAAVLKAIVSESLRMMKNLKRIRKFRVDT